jgi:hypothetical protein
MPTIPLSLKTGVACLIEDFFNQTSSTLLLFAPIVTMSPNRTSLAYSLDAFGPTIPEGFDFTLLFQDSLLSILPSALLLLILPVRIWSLRGKTRKVHRSLIYENKLVSCPNQLHDQLLCLIAPT